MAIGLARMFGFKFSEKFQLSLRLRFHNGVLDEVAHFDLHVATRLSFLSAGVRRGRMKHYRTCSLFLCFAVCGTEQTGGLLSGILSRGLLVLERMTTKLAIVPRPLAPSM